MYCEAVHGVERAGHDWATEQLKQHTYIVQLFYIYIERERERGRAFPGGASGKEPACQSVQGT